MTVMWYATVLTLKKEKFTASVWRERANSQNKYFHIHFSPLVSHVIHSYRCESINTDTTLTVMRFCFISQFIYCIIHSRCLKNTTFFSIVPLQLIRRRPSTT